MRPSLLLKIASGGFRLVGLIGIVMWLPVPVWAAAGDTKAGDPVGYLQKSYEKIADLQADFVQTLRFADFETPSVWTGKVALQRERGKGKMRWDFKAPEVFQVFVDGETVLHYTPEHRQALRSKMSGNPAGAMAFRLLAGVSDLTRDFDAYSTGNAHQIKFVPKDKTTGFLWIEATVAPHAALSGVVIERVVLQEESGNLTTFVFNNLKINTGIEPASFTFTPPKGVEIIPAP